MKKVLAGVSAAAITLTQVGSVLAAYSDVPNGIWYEEGVEAFLDAGYLDSSQPRFRGADPATRAEFVKLVVELNGGILSTPPAVASFDDVASGAWYYGYMEEAAKEGWVKGDSNCYGTHPCWARPNSKINRAEAAALIVRAFGLEWTGDAPQFVDNPSGQWYTDVIQTAADHCVLQGDDATGRVRPADNMNRAEMVVMLHRVDMGLMYGTDCGGEPTPSSPAITDVVATSATTVEVEFNAWLDEDTATDPSHYTVTNGSEVTVTGVTMIDESTVEITLATALAAREEFTLTVEDMMTTGGDMFSDSASFTGYSPIVQGDGILEVTPSSKNPVGDSVPKGAVGVVMASLDLTASCDDGVTIEDMTIVHEGFGDESDIDGVYAAVDGARMSRKRTIDSEDQTADLRFSQPLDIDACGTITVDIVADFASTAVTASEHNLTVQLASDFTSNAKEVKGNFPIRGNTFRIAAVTSGQITVSYRSVTPTEVEVGDTGAKIGKFELSTDSVEDQTIYSMTFEQDGSISDGDLVNVAVRRTDGTVLTNVAPTFVGDFITLVFDPPFTILEGDKITFDVVADVVGGAGDTIKIHFEETADLFAVGSLYGYGVNGQLYGSRVNIPTDNPTELTVDAGEFTIEIDGPVQQKYKRDSDDAVLANVIMTTGGEPVDIKDLFILIQAQTSTGGALAVVAANGTTYDNVHEVLEDVELRNTVTGRTISAVRLTGAAEVISNSTNTAQIYRFDDFVVDGKQTWQLRVDFIDNGSTVSPKSGDKFRVHICGQPSSSTTGCTFGGIITSTTAYNMKIEGLSTGDSVNDVRPGGTITGNFHRIANPELTIAVKSTGTSDTAVKNSKNIQLLRFEARAGEAEDVLLTKLIFESASGSLNNGQNYTLWVDSDADSTVDTKLESGVAAQTNQVTFDELAGGGFVIPAEETVIFEVHSDIAASLTNNDLQLRFATGSTVTFIEAEEADDGSNLSGIKLNGSFHNSVTSAQIIVTTAATKAWLLANQGDLFVTKDTVSLRNRQLLGGTLGEEVLRLQFRAQNEAVDVTDIQITSSGSTASSVDRLELFKAGSTTKFADATVGGCGSDDVQGSWQGSTVQTFCANLESHQLVVPEGDKTDVIVRPRMKTDEQGATSNQIVHLFIVSQAISNNATGSGAVRARGNESSNNLDANDGDTTAEGEVFIGTDTATSNSFIVGNKNFVVLAKLNSLTNANPDANDTVVPTGVSPFGQFKFEAMGNNNTLNGPNKWVLSGVVFNINATNVYLNPSNFKFYNKADNSSASKKACTAMLTTGTSIGSSSNASGSFLVYCGGLIPHVVDTALDSNNGVGESAVFVLEGDITNSQVVSGNTSTLQASIQSMTDYTATAFGATTSHLEWADMDTATTTFRWIEYGETVVKSTSYKS